MRDEPGALSTCPVHRPQHVILYEPHVHHKCCSLSRNHLTSTIKSRSAAAAAAAAAHTLGSAATTTKKKKKKERKKEKEKHGDVFLLQHTGRVWGSAGIIAGTSPRRHGMTKLLRTELRSDKREHNPPRSVNVKASQREESGAALV